jgi:acyl-[acyl-carrier-protein]-phospholipid O-acyltransferase/long-chain-fatty-acid--[acyl-carrier-protein] ligase
MDHRTEITTGLAERAIDVLLQNPGASLIEDAAGPVSNADVLSRAHAIGAHIRETSTADEEYIGLVMPTSTDAVIACLGVMLADRVPVFLNYTASPDAVDYAIERTAMKRFYGTQSFLDRFKLGDRPQTLTYESLRQAADAVDAGKVAEFANLPGAEARDRFFPIRGGSLDTVGTVLFSSGSTGTPKGVVLTQDNLRSNLNSVMQVVQLEPDDSIIGVLPFFHSFGFLATLWLPLLWGKQVVFHDNPIDAATIGDMVQKHQSNVLFATPTFLQVYTRRCTPEQFSTLRIVVTGAEKLRQPVADGFAEKFGTVPVEGFGCTETGPVVSLNLPDNPAEFGQRCGRVGTVGKPVPGVTVRIVDPDAGDERTTGEEGLLLVHGPNIMRGYLGDAERTAAVLESGWYNTGDIAKLDEDGYLVITGRLSRFSKIGGEMIPHGGVEDAIHEVIDAGNELKVFVTGVPDTAKGERLVVLHLPLPMEPADIVGQLRTSGIPNLWVPKPNAFYPVENFPLLGSGKLDLKGIQKLAEELAG